MKVGQPINNYEEFLQCCIEAAEKGYKSTKNEFHKGAANAYRFALKKFKSGQFPELAELLVDDTA